MDRSVVYPGAIPLDTDLLAVNRNAMIGLGYLAQAVLGASAVADGLACQPTSPNSMAVNIGPGSLTALSVIDSIAYGSLPADSGTLLVKMGVNLAGTQLTLQAPTTSGQAVNYLIEAAFKESDTDPVVLPYYNAANPSQPFSGAGNSGMPQPTRRSQTVQLLAKPGNPATAGTQTTPPTDN